MVVPFPAGAATDSARASMPSSCRRCGASRSWSTTRAAATAFRPPKSVARAKPDGLTIFATSAMTQAVNPALYDKLPYDPIETSRRSPAWAPRRSCCWSMRNSPINTRGRADGEAQGRRRARTISAPARCRRASPPSSTRWRPGVEAVYVGYKSNPQAIPDLQSGLLSFMMIDTVNAKIAIDRGALKGLFVTDTERYPPLPDLPTAAEAGCPTCCSPPGPATTCPKGTPREIVQKINADIRKVAAMPEVRARLDPIGLVAQADEPRRVRRLHALREGALGQHHPSCQHQARVGDSHARIAARQQGPPHPSRGRRERALRDHHRRQADADHRRGDRRHRPVASRCPTASRTRCIARWPRTA